MRSGKPPSPSRSSRWARLARGPASRGGRGKENQARGRTQSAQPKNDSARGGPQQLSRSGNQLEDAVALAVEKANARAQLALEHEDLEQVADAVGVPAEVLQEAVSEVQGNAIMPSQPSPQTSLKKPPSS